MAFEVTEDHMTCHCLWELAEYTNGRACKPAELLDEGDLPVIKISELNSGVTANTQYIKKSQVLEKHIIKKGDLLFAWSASLGVYCWQGSLAVLNQHIFKVVAKEGVDQDYLRYLLESKLEDLKNIASDKAVTMGHVTVEDLKKFKVSLPSLEKQKEIASILSAIDSRIENLKSTNETLEKMAQALFKSWFVDFDPVKAKSRGEKPIGMSDEIAELFPSEFEETENGPIPKGWTIKTINDVITTVGGGTPDTKNPTFWAPDTYYWVTPKDLSGALSSVLFTSSRKISDKGLKEITSGLIPAGSLLMSSRAPIGYLAINQVPVAINQGFIGMLSNGQVSPLFMLNWCKCNMDVIYARANGSTFMEINKKEFRKINIILPPKEILQQFEKIANSFLSLLVNFEHQRKGQERLLHKLCNQLIIN